MVLISSHTTKTIKKSNPLWCQISNLWPKRLQALFIHYYTSWEKKKQKRENERHKQLQNILSCQDAVTCHVHLEIKAPAYPSCVDDDSWECLALLLLHASYCLSFMWHNLLTVTLTPFSPSNREFRDMLKLKFRSFQNTRPSFSYSFQS